VPDYLALALVAYLSLAQLAVVSFFILPSHASFPQFSQNEEIFVPLTAA